MKYHMSSLPISRSRSRIGEGRETHEISEMNKTTLTPTGPVDGIDAYRLTDQIGHILRRASQRHTTIFSNAMLDGLTPTRFAALAMLRERGSLSQNELGRLTAMDIATITGVVRWLVQQGFVKVGPYPNDSRRNLLELTGKGRCLLEKAIPLGQEISLKTLEPLTAREAERLIELLRKIA